MARPCKLPTAAEIARINEVMIQQHGGFYVAEHQNLMRPGTLEALLEECQGTFFGEERYPSVIDKAAMLGWRIIAGHVFRDGNKRTGLQVCRTVLFLNGYMIPVDETTRDVILAIAAGNVALDEFTEWLAHTAVRL